MPLLQYKGYNMKALITFEDISMDGWIILRPQHLNNLSDFIDDSECKELVLDNVIQYVPFNQIPNLLLLLIKKLRHGGKITINFVETIEVFKKFVNGQLNLIDLNKAIFGENKHASIVSIPTICEVFENSGLIIRLKQLNEFNATIEAERP